MGSCTLNQDIVPHYKNVPHYKKHTLKDKNISLTIQILRIFFLQNGIIEQPGLCVCLDVCVCVCMLTQKVIDLGTDI